MALETLNQLFAEIVRAKKLREINRDPQAEALNALKTLASLAATQGSLLATKAQVEESRARQKESALRLQAQEFGLEQAREPIEEEKKVVEMMREVKVPSSLRARYSSALKKRLGVDPSEEDIRLYHIGLKFPQFRDTISTRLGLDVFGPAPPGVAQQEAIRERQIDVERVRASLRKDVESFRHKLASIRAADEALYRVATSIADAFSDALSLEMRLDNPIAVSSYLTNIVEQLDDIGGIDRDTKKRLKKTLENRIREINSSRKPDYTEDFKSIFNEISRIIEERANAKSPPGGSRSPALPSINEFNIGRVTGKNAKVYELVVDKSGKPIVIEIDGEKRYIPASNLDAILKAAEQGNTEAIEIISQIKEKGGLK